MHSINVARNLRYNLNDYKHVKPFHPEVINEHTAGMVPALPHKVSKLKRSKSTKN